MCHVITPQYRVCGTPHSEYSTPPVWIIPFQASTQHSKNHTTPHTIPHFSSSHQNFITDKTKNSLSSVSSSEFSWLIIHYSTYFSHPPSLPIPFPSIPSSSHLSIAFPFHLVTLSNALYSTQHRWNRCRYGKA